MGLKLGKAFSDLGAKTGRETIRALPMAVADLVQEVFEDEAVRGPARHPRHAVHLHGPVGHGHRGRVPERFRRQRRGSGGHRGVRARRHRRARRRPSASAAKARGVDIRTGREVDGDPLEERARGGRHHRRRHRDRRRAGRLGGRPQAHAAPVRPRGAGPARWSGARTTSASRARPPR